MKIKYFITFIFIFLVFGVTKVNASSGQLCSYEAKIGIAFDADTISDKIISFLIMPNVISLDYTKPNILYISPDSASDGFSMFTLMYDTHNTKYKGLATIPSDFYSFQNLYIGGTRMIEWDSQVSSYRLGLIQSGYCPEQILVYQDTDEIGTDEDEEYTAIDKLHIYKDIFADSDFDPNNPDAGDYWNVYFKLYSTYLEKDWIIVYQLADSEFNDQALYNEIYTEMQNSTCLDKDKAEYLNDEFHAAGDTYSSNSTYVNMFRDHNFDTMANVVLANYGEGQTCYTSNPDLQDIYIDLYENAKKFLGVLDVTPQQDLFVDIDVNCQYLLGDPDQEGSFAYYLDITFRFIKFLAPLLLISLSIFDYTRAIVASDADLIKKINNKTIIRLIFALLLFVLPIIISIILDLLGAQGDCGLSSMPNL